MGAAVVLDQQDKSKSALNFAQKGLELAPDNPDYWFIYGDILQQNKLFDKAIEAYRKSADINPSNEEIWSDMALLLYRELNDEYQSLEVLMEGLLHHENNAEIFFSIGAIYLLTGNMTEAQSYLEKGIKADPNKLSIIVEFNPLLKEHPYIIQVENEIKRK